MSRYFFFVSWYMNKCGFRKSTNLKAWMTTVPNKMNKAEKMRDRRGIISRLNRHRNDRKHVGQQMTTEKTRTSYGVKMTLQPTSCYVEYHR